MDVCCIQEILYHGGNCCTIKGKDTRYKLYLSGNDKGTAGVGVLVAEEWIEKVFQVQSLRQNHLSETCSWLACGYHSVCECPTQWSSDRVKDLFLDQLGAVTARIRISDPMWRLEWPCRPCRHWIQGSAWWDGVWLAGTRCWGDRTLEYALAFNLLLIGLGGSVGCALRPEASRSQVQPLPRSETFFHRDWSWNIFYDHSLPFADSRSAVVSFWQKNVQNTG